MKKVIFIYPKKASFINLDIEILAKKYTIVKNTYNWSKKSLLPLFLFKQFFFLLANIRTTNYIIVSFGGYWSMLPSFIGWAFKTPVFIILHGTDCASFKEINYGNMRKPLMRNVLKISYYFATKLLPVSQSLVYNENTYFSSTKIIKQGYKSFLKKNITPYTVVHNGIDTKKWHADNNIQRHKNRFITVLSEGQFILKGGDLIIDVAKNFPQYEFFLIGLEKPTSLENLSPNVTFVSKQPSHKLFEYYNSSHYYFQLSLTEGFGCALAEAMSCGCIPIVSNVNILPKIIENSGYVLTERKTDSLVQLINNLADDNLLEQPRNRITENYTIEKRQQELFKVLEKDN